SKTSIRLPLTMGASVWASMVRKKLGSPTTIWGMSRTARTLAHPTVKRSANNQADRFMCICDAYTAVWDKTSNFRLDDEKIFACSDTTTTAGDCTRKTRTITGRSGTGLIPD